MVNPFENVWSKGSKAHLEEENIGLENAISEDRGLESTLEGKGNRFVKKKMIFMKN